MRPLLITLWATLITATLHANQIMYVASITDKTIVSFELDQDTGKLQQLQSTTLPIPLDHSVFRHLVNTYTPPCPAKTTET